MLDARIQSPGIRCYNHFTSIRPSGVHNVFLSTPNGNYIALAGFHGDLMETSAFIGPDFQSWHIPEMACLSTPLVNNLDFLPL